MQFPEMLYIIQRLRRGLPLIRPPNGGTDNYSLLRPIIGSMRVARSAGRKEANDATPTMTER